MRVKTIEACNIHFFPARAQSSPYTPTQHQPPLSTPLTVQPIFLGQQHGETLAKITLAGTKLVPTRLQRTKAPDSSPLAQWQMTRTSSLLGHLRPRLASRMMRRTSSVVCCRRMALKQPTAPGKALPLRLSPQRI